MIANAAKLVNIPNTETGFSLTSYLDSFTPAFGLGTPVFSENFFKFTCGTPTFSKRYLLDSYFLQKVPKW